MTAATAPGRPGAPDLPPRPASGPRQRPAEEPIRQARQARAAGDLAGAWEIIESAIRCGLWTHSKLWSELVSLMRSPADYQPIRELWLATPASCHDHVPVLRVVARAASVAGAHDDARLLLGKAIVIRSRLANRTRVRLRPLKRWARAVRSRGGRSAGRSGGRPGGEGFADRAAVAMADLDTQLGELGVRAFLISGTLLGYVREGGFISWDKDIDLGFFTEEISPAELEEAFVRSSAFMVRRLDFNTDRLRVNHLNGMMIDIFPHYPEGDRVWHDGTATRWWNSPFELTTVEFLGRTQYVPDPPERYLAENYGDWRTPRPNFDARIDTPNVEVTDPEYFHTLLYFSLLDALLTGDRRKRRRYRQLLIERGKAQLSNA